MFKLSRAHRVSIVYKCSSRFCHQMPPQRCLSDDPGEEKLDSSHLQAEWEVHSGGEEGEAAEQEEKRAWEAQPLTLELSSLSTSDASLYQQQHGQQQQDQQQLAAARGGAGETRFKVLLVDILWYTKSIPIVMVVHFRNKS